MTDQGQFKFRILDLDANERGSHVYFEWSLVYPDRVIGPFEGNQSSEQFENVVSFCKNAVVFDRHGKLMQGTPALWMNCEGTKHD